MSSWGTQGLALILLKGLALVLIKALVLVLASFAFALANPDDPAGEDLDLLLRPAGTRGDSPKSEAVGEQSGEPESPDSDEGAAERSEEPDTPSLETAPPSPGEAATVAPAEAVPRRRQVEEIVVTAQRKEETLQDVPVSVATISGAVLEEKALTTFDDVARTIPSVEMVTTNSANQTYVRGMGTDQSSEADASVIMVVDDIALPGRIVGTDIFSDIERVEFLRGPQGTLFGKNTVAGAINVVTREPHDDWEARLSAGVGNLGRRDARLILNVPVLEERLALRLNGAIENTDGYIRNTFTDRDEGGRERWYGSLKALVRLTDDIELSLKGNKAADEFTNGRQVTDLDESQEAVIRESYDEDFESELDHRMSANGDNTGTIDSQLYSALLRWALPAGYSVLGAVGYAETLTVFGFDADQTPIPAIDGPAGFEDDALSFELRLESPPSLFDRLSFISGAYYSRTNSILGLDVVAAQLDSNAAALFQGPNAAALSGATLPLADALTPFGAAERLIIERDQTLDDLAFYGQGVVDLFFDLDLTLGARYARTNVHLNRSLVDGEVAGQRGAVGPIGAVILTNAGLEPTRLDRRDEERSEDAWTGKAALRWQPTDDVTCFTNVAQGFKPGLYRVAPKSADDRGFASERSITYELGTKLALLDRAARVNVTLFHTDYEDLQVVIPFQTGKITDNAAEALSRGVELESQWILPLGLTGDLNYGFLDAKFESFPAGPCRSDESPNQETGGCERAGDPLAYAPEHSLQLGLGGQWPLFDWPFALTAGVDATFQTRMQLSINNEPIDSRPNQWLTNARVGLAGESGRWTAGLFVNNLTDELYRIQSTIGILPGSHSAIVSPPRLFKVGATLTF